MTNNIFAKTILIASAFVACSADATTDVTATYDMTFTGVAYQPGRFPQQVLRSTADQVVMQFPLVSAGIITNGTSPTGIVLGNSFYDAGLSLTTSYVGQSFNDLVSARLSAAGLTPSGLVSTPVFGMPSAYNSVNIGFQPFSPDPTRPYGTNFTATTSQTVNLTGGTGTYQLWYQANLNANPLSTTDLSHPVTLDEVPGMMLDINSGKYGTPNPTNSFQSQYSMHYSARLNSVANGVTSYLWDIEYTGYGQLSSLKVGGTELISPVPEPEAYALMLVGLGVLCAVVSRRKKQSAKQLKP